MFRGVEGLGIAAVRKLVKEVEKYVEKGRSSTSQPQMGGS